MAVRSDSTPVPAAATVRGAQITTWACYLALFACGGGSSLIGPSLPALAAHFGWSLSSMGVFPALQSAGIMIGVLAGGLLLERFGARGSMVIGAVLVFGGMWLFNFAPVIAVAFAAMLAIGLGFGLLTVGPNVIIQLLNPSREGAALNRLNIFYAIGAIIGPQIANFALAHGGYGVSYLITGVLTLMITVLMTQVTIRPPAASRHAPRARISGRELLLILPFATALFVYVGIEVGYTSWISTQMQLVALSTAAVGALATSLFWFGLTMGRAAASITLRHINEQQLLIGTSILIMAGAALLLINAHSELLALIFTFVIGFGCGPVFPTAFALVGRQHPVARGALSGVLIASGSIGSVFLPPLQGTIGAGQNGGMIVTLVGGAALLLLFSLIWRQSPRPVQASVTTAD